MSRVAVLNLVFLVSQPWLVVEGRHWGFRMPGNRAEPSQP
jgi:hypothetical protein